MMSLDFCERHLQGMDSRLGERLTVFEFTLCKQRAILLKELDAEPHERCGWRNGDGKEQEREPSRAAEAMALVAHGLAILRSSGCEE
jgi:hypothetical protein